MHTNIFKEGSCTVVPNGQPRARDAAFWCKQDEKKTKTFKRLVAGFRDIESNPNHVFIGRSGNDVMRIVDAIKNNNDKSGGKGVSHLKTLIESLGLEPLHPVFGGMRPGGPKPGP